MRGFLALHGSWIICVLVISLSAQVMAADGPVAAAVERGDAFDDQLKTREALAAYLEAEKLGGKDAELLRKIAREYAESMGDVSSLEERRSLGEKAVPYAQRAVAADPANAMAHLALAICYGRLAPLMDSKTKIAYSKMVKDQVDQSIKLDPTIDYSYHVLGAWNYELAGLNPVLRLLAKLIYGDVPSASYEEAVRNFKKAIELAPHRVAHHVELGRTYAAMGQTALAREELNKGLALPSREKDDPQTKERGRAALKNL